MILQALESHGDVFNMHTFIVIRQFLTCIYLVI